MSDTLAAPETLERVYVYTGQVAHLLDPKQPPLPGLTAERMPALCSIRPIWPGLWWNDDLKVKPLCRNCESAARGLDYS